MLNQLVLFIQKTKLYLKLQNLVDTDYFIKY